jgi:phosphomannomutase
MGRGSAQVRQVGLKVVFSFEEAMGFCIGDLVLDKDGVSAAAVLGEIVGTLREEGQSLSGHLRELQETYGCYVNLNSYVKCHDKEILKRIFDKLRTNGGQPGDESGRHGYPTELAGFKVKSVRDLTVGYDSARVEEGCKASLPADPSSQFLTFTLENGAVVSLRGSGTEPKLKYYIETVTTMGGEGSGSEEEGRTVCERILEKGVMLQLIGMDDPEIAKEIQLK